MKKRRVEALLRETDVDLVAGEALLAQKKTAEKRAKSKLARRNTRGPRRPSKELSRRSRLIASYSNAHPRQGAKVVERNWRE